MNHLFLFTGAETFLIHEQIQAWKQAFLEKHGDINLIQLDGEKAEVGELIAQMEALPFLGEKRLIFIEGLPAAPKSPTARMTKKDEAAAQKEEALIKVLDSIPETSVVVFIQPAPDKRKKLYKKFVQKAQVKTFDKLEGADLNHWVQNQAQKYKARLDASVAHHLISLTGSDLWRLEQEIKKLALYAEEENITRAMIDELVTPHVEANIFHFTDALSTRSAKQAMSHLHRSIEAGESLNQLFYMIIRQFRLFLQADDYLKKNPSGNASGVASMLKIHPFVARNITRQVKGFRSHELKAAYLHLLSLDEALKTSKIRLTADDQTQLALAIEQFILEFCH